MSPSKERAPIGVVGVGWVGLATAACFAELGHRVVARDILPEKVEALRAGRIPIHEPRLEELLERNSERLLFTTEAGELEEAELVFICVETPPTASGDADLSSVMRAIGELDLGGERAVVMKSTVPAGTGQAIRRDVPGISYVSNPEFLREGSAVSDFLEPDRIVIGADDEDEDAADKVAELYAPLEAPIVRTDLASAEMIKLASNAFLATKISFINEIANVSEELGADVTEVARGMGLDPRIGDRFLNAGLGFGGSCLAGDESVLVRRQGRVWRWTLEELFERIAEDETDANTAETNVRTPEELEVLSWRPDSSAPEFLGVSTATRRRFEGHAIELRTKMGRRLICTPDHPFVVGDGNGEHLETKLAEDLDETDWLPLAQGSPDVSAGPNANQVVLSAMAGADLGAADVIIRPAQEDLDLISGTDSQEREKTLRDHRRGHSQRSADISRNRALRLDEAHRFELSLGSALAGTARNGTYVPVAIDLDEDFWRVAGLYIAEGHCTIDGPHNRHRLQWSFHPTDEVDLVEEVASYWRALGVKAIVRRNATSTAVSVSSKLLGAWWLHGLGLGANAYEQRIPDQAWTASEEHQRALLAGLWLGDGSWSYVNQGPSVILEYGTASPELADGILRMLANLDIVASLRVGRTKKSTCDNHWLRISGAEQIERALFLVPAAERAEIRESIARQSKRIAPTGYRRHRTNAAWVRLAGTRRIQYSGDVYSLEVPGAQTFVTTGGLVTHNCFPKDTQALKQLAGNTGYHFQLLSSVIEVNELQKRRVIGKLTKHLGPLAGKRIALLGLAFKPDTDDMREASSLVLAARLKGEGATVAGYDPVAGATAGKEMPDVEICSSAIEALEGADAAVLVTEWPEFAELDWKAVREAMANPLLVDGRNFLEAERLRAAGFDYEGVGRPAGAAEAKPA